MVEFDALDEVGDLPGLLVGVPRGEDLLEFPQRLLVGAGLEPGAARQRAAD